MKKIRTTVLCLIFLSTSLMANAQGLGLVTGLEVAPLLSISSNYGWEIFAAYPTVGLQLGDVRVAAFGGGGLSLPLDFLGKTYYDDRKITWTYGFGGNLEYFSTPG
jgi:hypothetical protein